MALLLKKRSNIVRGITIIAIWATGITAVAAAPLSQTLTVTSPSNALAKSQVTPMWTDALSFMQTAKGKDVTKQKSTQAAITVSSSDCATSAPVRPGLPNALSLHLKKLAEYDHVCMSAAIHKQSFFVATPTTKKEAIDYATDVSNTLREFAKFGITPVVFMEPTTSAGLVDLHTYQAGAYDVALDTYFSTLRSTGITDTMMGIWVPIPEGNIPVWTSVDPIVFADCVTKAVTYQKKYFPTSKASILLDNQSYPSADNWEGGQVVSLVPYLQNIPSGLIDSFGLQGFPWSPPANEGGPDIERPQDYLRVDLAVEAARKLNVKDVWFNTGTFSVKYAGQTGRQVAQTPEQRGVALSTVVSQIKPLVTQGFHPSIHLFAEDKSRVAEATDWSYWSQATIDSNASVNVFRSFMHDSQAASIPVWLFDTK